VHLKFSHVSHIQHILAATFCLTMSHTVFSTSPFISIALVLVPINNIRTWECLCYLLYCIDNIEIICPKIWNSGSESKHNFRSFVNYWDIGRSKCVEALLHIFFELVNELLVVIFGRNLHLHSCLSLVEEPLFSRESSSQSSKVLWAISSVLSSHMTEHTMTRNLKHIKKFHSHG